MGKSLLNRRAFGRLVGAMGVAAALPLRATEQNEVFPRFSKGINLHHLLNWPDTKPGSGKTEYVWPPFETSNYQISDEELTKLKAMGFDFLRVTADPSIFIAVDKAKLEHLTALVLRIMTRLISAGFKVIFDLHPVSVNPDFVTEKLLARIDGPAFQAYAGLVEHMARALDSLPHEAFAFELMNEPWMDRSDDLERWQPMLERLHSRARQGAPTLPLVLTGARWSDAKALMKLDLRPFKGSNVLYTFHNYDPHTFTHQGVEGDEGEFLAGLQWPASPENLDKVREDAFKRVDATKKPAATINQLKEVTRKLLSDYGLTAYSRTRMHADFDGVAKWAAEHGIPKERVFLGEFGCVNAANHIPLGKDRVQWLRAMRDTAQEFGFGWAIWAYKGYGGMGLYDENGKLDAVLAEALELKI